MIPCTHCAQEFKPKRVQAGPRYCSVKCRMKALCLKNRRRVARACRICGRDFEIRPSEMRNVFTCSDPCYRRAKMGERNPRWRGGVSSSRKAAMSRKEYKYWRAKVFKRDNFTCVDCGQRGGDLEADHVKQWAHYPRLRYAVSNGLTRCKSCHRKRSHTHSRAYQYKLWKEGSQAV
jgi:5-methylcytosine-specific restriction endonuclease McrA